MSPVIIFLGVLGIGGLLMGIKNGWFKSPSFTTSIGRPSLPTLNQRILWATLAGLLFFCFWFWRETTIDVLQWFLFSYTFWGLFLTALIFWAVWKDQWDWFWQILIAAVVILLIIWIVGLIWGGSSDKSKPDSAGNPIVKNGVLVSRFTPLSPVVTVKFMYEIDGPVYIRYETTTGVVTQYVKDNNSRVAAPENRYKRRPIEIISANPNRQVWVIIKADN